MMWKYAKDLPREAEKKMAEIILERTGMTAKEQFGAFVGSLERRNGSKERINMVEDVLTLGDVVKCKCMGKDKMGRISFSIKDAE